MGSSERALLCRALFILFPDSPFSCDYSTIGESKNGGGGERAQDLISNWPSLGAQLVRSKRAGGAAHWGTRASRCLHTCEERGSSSPPTFPSFPAHLPCTALKQNILAPLWPCEPVNVADMVVAYPQYPF